MFQINYNPTSLVFEAAYDTECGMQSPEPYFEITAEQYTEFAKELKGDMSYVNVEEKTIVGGIVKERQQYARALAYKNEADGLYMAWQSDRALKSEDEATAAYDLWVAKVAEIKARYPLTRV
jgi:hypothetical protein